MVCKQWNIVPPEEDIVRISFKSAYVLQAQCTQGTMLADCIAVRQLE